ncbi:hypothetical protein E2C01_055449 [Portunus trituberculatus]|uniref:Uncharacterized protein n=1 Tax=Portunus trituberculatus TaxID=210409 RepID=A0A5B7GVY9_PORTR|nr:hypothetical protein [Portunus trituberculatus]
MLIDVVLFDCAVLQEKSWDICRIKIKIKIKPLVDNTCTTRSHNSVSSSSSSLAKLTTKTPCNVA